MDFEKLLGSSVEVSAVIENITLNKNTNNEMIVLANVHVNGEYFRDHSWIKMTKRLSKVSIGDKISATATLINYIDSSSIKNSKYGLKSFRNVQITKD